MEKMRSTSRCVWCEEPTESLFVRYTSSVVKLQTCSRCGKYVDEYIEHDNLGIFLDILLQKRAAYRHVLFNTGYKVLWRFLLVVVMADAYVNWIGWRAKDTEVSSALSVDLLEWEFQKRLLVSAFVHAIFLFGTSFVGIKRLGNGTASPSFSFFFNGMIVSLFAVVLKLPAVIWRASSKPFDSMFWGCWMLQLISGRQVYMILSKTSEIESFATVSLFLLCSLLFQTYWDPSSIFNTVSA